MGMELGFVSLHRGGVEHGRIRVAHGCRHGTWRHVRIGREEVSQNNNGHRWSYPLNAFIISYE